MTDNVNIFHNPNAKAYTYQTEVHISPKTFHAQLPNFELTPLKQVPSSLFDLDHVHVKDESQRMGLPSFKILGASWGTLRSIAEAFDVPLDAEFELVRAVSHRHKVHLVTATDGNHGRAIAHMAKLLGIEATVFVPETVNEYTRGLIRSEGATVIVDFHDYDAAVKTAYEFAREFPNHLYVQDTSFEAYHEVPTWIVQGYATMFQEVEEQLNDLGLKATHVFTPVGVGSLAHAVVKFCKSEGRSIRVVAVESELAACLQTSLYSGANTTISTKMTIMDGINCGTVSEISWPILKNGVDTAMTISDRESHHMVSELAKIAIDAGPCGASTSAALQKLLRSPQACRELGLDQSSVIVLLNTEGSREYVALV